jgi:hypothetical protein
MKNTAKLLSLFLSCLLIFMMSACSKQVESPNTDNSADSSDGNGSVEKSGVWENATYLEDKEFGSGSKTIVVEVKAADQKVTFTIKTDKDTVGAALFEHNLIDGENGPYGLYVKVVNGITADYDKTQTYWALKKNGKDLMTGVDMTEITDGEHYEFVYTK